MRRDFENVKRIVVKIGTSVLTKPDGSLDKEYMQEVAQTVLRNNGAG